MKIVFVSNFLNHHQLPISLDMLDRDIDYKFVSMTPIPEARLSLGYEDMNKKYDWIIRSYENMESKTLATKVVQDADIVVSGGMYKDILADRIKNKKLTFIYSERTMKNGNTGLGIMKTALHMNMIYRFCQKNNVHILCSSAFTSADMNKAKLFKNKCYKWGYFPAVEEYDIDAMLESKRAHEKMNILWCGRFLDWKHPEYAVLLAEQLKKKNIPFIVNMIGDGGEQNKIKELIKAKELDDTVKVLGSVNAQDVREYMRNADIFLFTSDYYEGWGAVLNEAMNSGCAVVVSHAIGSVPYLIEDGKNGCVYENGNVQQFCSKVEKLIEDSTLRENISREAYHTMVNEWNPHNAVGKLLRLSEELQSGNFDIESGVCSKAEIIENNWYK